MRPSIAAFARTLKTHRTTLQKVLDGEEVARATAAATAFVAAQTPEDNAELGLEEEDAEKAMAADEDAEAATASAPGVVDATLEDLRAELAIVDEMLALAEKHAARPDARVKGLVEWIRNSMLDGRQWNRRRLIIFTEWEDTRRWLERRLTKTYNRFHDAQERCQNIIRLRELHAAMDRAVLRAYGWNDLAERAAPVFLDETNEDDHPYQGRLLWPSDFCDEVLARLLALNAERHAEEVRLGIAPGMKGKVADDDDGEEELDM